MNSSIRALRTRSFALLWSGQALSQLGERIFQVALAWWVLEKTGSAVAMGTLFTMSIIPMLVFLLIGGVLVDRLPRVRLMLISDLTRGLIVGLIALLAFTNRLVVEHLYVFSLVNGFVDAFFQPAYRAAVPELVAEQDLPSANSLSSLSGQFAGIVGPAAGAALVALGGTALAFALNGLSFFISALCLVPVLKRSTIPQQISAAANVFRELREGFAAVRSAPWLWVTIGIAGLSNIAYAGPMEVVLPFLIQDRHADVAVLGLFYSGSAAGSVLAAIAVGRLPRLRRRGLTLYGSWMLIGLMVIVVGLPIPIPGILVAATVIGACNTILGLVWVNTLQEMVPRELLGRVTSIDYLGSFILLPTGFAIGGWAYGLIGAPAVFIVGGTLETLLIALGLLHPKIRSLD